MKNNKHKQRNKRFLPSSVAYAKGPTRANKINPNKYIHIILLFDNFNYKDFPSCWAIYTFPNCYLSSNVLTLMLFYMRVICYLERS